MCDDKNFQKTPDNWEVAYKIILDHHNDHKPYLPRMLFQSWQFNVHEQCIWASFVFHFQ